VGLKKISQQLGENLTVDELKVLKDYFCGYLRVVG
jgi:hypothetical protein